MILKFKLNMNDSVAFRTEHIAALDLSENTLEIVFVGVFDRVPYVFETENKAKQAFNEICDAMEEDTK